MILTLDDTIVKDYYTCIVYEQGRSLKRSNIEFNCPAASTYRYMELPG